MHSRFMALNTPNNVRFKRAMEYGDGRAISIFEGIFNGKRWEMQLKGAVRHPIVVAQMGVPSFVRVCESSWRRNTCMRQACRRRAR